MANRQDLVKTGSDTVKLRADYQVTPNLIQKNVLPNAATPHDLKIARYRDRLLISLAGKINPALFDKLDRRSEALLDTLTDNSEIAMYSDLQQYVTFCCARNLEPLPFHDYAVDAYLSTLMAKGRKRNTIDRHLASLVKWAHYLELDDPRKSFKVKTRIMNIRKKVKSHVKQAEGLRVVHLERALTELNPKVPRDCQDITLLFVGFETLCRQSELVRFDWQDFELQADGTGLLHLAWSKTDQDGEGEYLFLSRNTSDLLLGWRSISNPKDVANTPIFRGIYSDGAAGKRLSTRGVQRSFKRTAQRLNLEPSIFSGHSTRVGSAQEMIERNIDSSKVMLSGRWKTMGMLTKYAKKINAKRSGMADLTRDLGWNSQVGRNELNKIGKG